jgi:lipopolysaccharide biosynthesis regulator YciM
MPADYFPPLFWLLVPIAAASGWYAARWRTPPGKETPQELSSNYFKGLNYLLNEQPDKAIEVLIKSLQVESDTVETHLTLGNLFRRRGEVDRAICLHQNLIAQSSLNKEQRCLALLELGMDYMRSGWLDRAEGLFKKLLEQEVDLYARQALKQLLELYQLEQDWEKAIACAWELESRCGEDMHTLTGHLYCEQAEQSIWQGDSGGALSLVKKALSVDSCCVRASLMEGMLTMEAGQPRLAIRCYKRVEHQDAEFLGEAMRPLMECYRALGRLDEFGDYVRSVSANSPGITPILFLAELIANQHGLDQAINYLGQELQKRPSVRGLDRLLEYALMHLDGLSRPQVELLKKFTSSLLKDKFTYKCRHCGFMAKTLHWQCPSCNYWNTEKPIYGIEGV